MLDTIAKVETDSLDKPFTDVPMEVNVLALTAEELSELGYEVGEKE